MLCLALEGTAHTISIAIVDDKGKIFANVKDMYTTEEGGLKPGKIADHHVVFYSLLLERVLKEAKINLSEIDLIAFSQGPGLGGSLRTGGDKRTSNFLSFQSAYSEWIFLEKFWPEFEEEDLISAVSEYSNRKRRFGK